MTEFEEVSSSLSPLKFAKLDYGFFVLMLALSALIGIYFGFISKKKQDNTAEYLLGGKTMSTFPVAASLISSHISGIALLSIPAEIYANGSQYFVFPICIVIIGLLMSFVYLPVFFELNITSCFTYLELRFGRKVRSIASVIYAISCLVQAPIIMYTPALALNQVTGINVHYITPVISLICTFYTTVGGLRAVVWTDTLQFLVMVGSVVTVCTIGIFTIGGLSEVWTIADRGGRVILFNIDPDPLIRTSFWTITLGLTTIWLSNIGVSQGCVQKFLSVPNLHEARKAMVIFVFGHIGFKLFSAFTGLLIYAQYEKCDPISNGLVKKLDQILPYYVMDVAGYLPGLPGLFISGIFAASLSSMSASLNTLAGTIFEDFIRNKMPNVTEKKASNIMKAIVIALGFFQLLLVPIIENLGSMFHLTLSFTGVTAGTMIGMFTFGMFVRKGNTKGVICGIIASMLGVGTLLVGAQMVAKPPTLPFRTDGCNSTLFDTNFLNATTTMSSILELPAEPHWIFKISFMYYSLIGLIIMFLVAYPISLLTGGTENLDETLLTPCMRSKAYKINAKDKAKVMPEYIEVTQILNGVKSNKEN